MAGLAQTGVAIKRKAGWLPALLYADLASRTLLDEVDFGGFSRYGFRGDPSIGRAFAEDGLYGEQPGPPNSNQTDILLRAFAMPKKGDEKSAT
jgi:hypothetical protein